MQEFGGQGTVCGTLARKGKLLAAAVVLSVALTACGGGGNDTPAAASSQVPKPGATPTSPGGSLTGSGGSPTTPGSVTNPGGTPTSPGGALAGGGSTTGSGTSSGDVTTPPSAGEEDGSTGTGSVTLSWIPPTMNDDGSPLKLTGYRIYWGPSDDDFTHSILVENPGLTRYVVEQLSAGTWYFVATALSGDRESEFSNVFSMTIN